MLWGGSPWEVERGLGGEEEGCDGGGNEVEHCVFNTPTIVL